MKAAMMSTWWDYCGIATYSEQLTVALEESGMEVVVLAAEKNGQRPDDPASSAKVIECWDRRALFPERIVQEVIDQGVQLIHIQHEHGLFLRDEGQLVTGTDRELLELIRMLREASIPVVVTLHTVESYQPTGRAGFYDAIKSLANVLIVHTHMAEAVINCASGDAEVITIPHGSNTHLYQTFSREVEGPTPDERAAGIELLKLDESAGMVILQPGFVGPSKNVLGTIQSFALAYLSLPCRCTLVVRGKPNFHHPYVHKMEEVVERLNRPISMQYVYTEPKDLPAMYAAADLVVLNTTSNTFSSSGQVHQAAVFGCPLVVANRPIYHQAIAAGAVPFDVGIEHEASMPMANAMVGMINSENLRRRVSCGMAFLAGQTSWSTLAKNHYKPLYERVVDEQ